MCPLVFSFNTQHVPVVIAGSPPGSYKLLHAQKLVALWAVCDTSNSILGTADT